jgi:hypothetical protein
MRPARHGAAYWRALIQFDLRVRGVAHAYHLLNG